MNTAFLLASAGGFLICGLHIFGGGRENIRPLLASKELSFEVVMTLYYAWHLVTITLAGIGLMFLVAARDETQVLIALSATVLSGAFAVLSVLLTAAKGLRFAVLPQWVFFAPVAVCGIWGLMA